MTKEAAQELIQTLKELLKTGVYYLPRVGKSDHLFLRSVQSPKDRFTVYINRSSRIVENKYSLLLHYPEEGLLRIDINGREHKNPDGSLVSCPHIHMRIKDTGAWDAYAFDLPAVFGDTEDCAATLRDYLQYCHTNNIKKLTICEQKEIPGYGKNS